MYWIKICLEARSLQIQVLTYKSETIFEARVTTRSFMRLIFFASIDNGFPGFFSGKRQQIIFVAGTLSVGFPEI